MDGTTRNDSDAVDGLPVAGSASSGCDYRSARHCLMTERRLSAAAEQFFESRIASLLHLEILLLLRRDPTRWLNAPDVAAVRRVSDETAERVLEQLAAANLIDIRIRGRLTFRFAPTESTVLPLMDEIAVAHHDDRQALERLLGRGRGGSGAARAFADASGCREGRQVPSLVYSLCAVTSRLCSVLLLVPWIRDF